MESINYLKLETGLNIQQDNLLVNIWNRGTEWKLLLCETIHSFPDATMFYYKHLLSSSSDDANKGKEMRPI